MPSVLIVDDEPMICKYLSNRYKREGYDTLTATNGKDALLICKKTTPDVIITDVKMPDTTGVDLIHDLKNLNNYNPVIVCITAYYDLSLKEIYEMGVDALFNKPFKIGEILGATKKFLQNRDNHLENKEQFFENRSVISLGSGLFPNEHINLIAELSAGIIHNINNHIAFILTSSFILKKHLEEEYAKNPSNEKYLKISDKLNTHATMVTKIIKSIKILAYPNTQASKKENIRVISILQSSIDLLEDIFKTNLIKCDINCAEDIDILCYPEQVIQIFINLIKNSCESISSQNLEERWININITKVKNDVEISFTDSGTGISKEIIPQLMQPFYTTKNRKNGIGLGLSICKKFMELHDGTLSFDESSKNTRFILSFKGN
jgi:two-component system, NtrC family, sensor kinase